MKKNVKRNPKIKLADGILSNEERRNGTPVFQSKNWIERKKLIEKKVAAYGRKNKQEEMK